MPAGSAAASWHAGLMTREAAAEILERIALLLELKGKLGQDLSLPASVANDNQADILQALLALGYSEKEAGAALKSLPAEIGVSEGIKLAMKKLS